MREEDAHPAVRKFRSRTADGTFRVSLREYICISCTRRSLAEKKPTDASSRQVPLGCARREEIRVAGINRRVNEEGPARTSARWMEERRVNKVELRNAPGSRLELGFTK